MRRSERPQISRIGIDRDRSCSGVNACSHRAELVKETMVSRANIRTMSPATSGANHGTRW